MPDAIIPAPGATPPASPVDQVPPGTPPETPPETPKDPGTPPKSEKVSNATHARQRIADKATRLKQASEKQSPPSDDIDPSEEEVVKKVMEKNGYGDLQKDLSEIRSASDQQEIRKEVEETITSSPYGEYLTADEKDKVHKLSLDDKYVHLPIDELITLSISGRIAEVGAEIAKKASAKIKDSRIPTSGSSIGNPEKETIRTPAEWAKERAQRGFSS